MYRRGISPVIATVIIVAVAVAISIAVVGWIMGLWGSIAGGTESLKIYPDSYLLISGSNTEVHLHIANTGSASAVIYKVEVAGLDEASITDSTGEATVDTNAGTATLDPGIEEPDLVATINDKTCTAGAYYLVKVYTKAGNVYQANVICKSSS